MTKEEFEREYSENTGMSPEKLKEIGLSAVACDCGKPQCRGWRMVHWAEVR